MDSKKSNKIREIVKLQQIVKQWKKLACSPKNNINNTNNSNPDNSTTKSIKFLKKTLSFSDRSSSSNTETDGTNIPKGYLAVCVGVEEKRFIIPTMYLGHRAFGKLLREAEEEYGFQQEGILKLPCEVYVFQKILKTVEKNKRGDDYRGNNNYYGGGRDVKDFQIGPCFSPDEYDHHLDYPYSQYHPQMCR